MSADPPGAVYDALLANVPDGATADEVLIGLTWTFVRSGTDFGLAQSPGLASRTLPWPGTIAGRPLKEVAEWVRSWDLFEATIGLAALNAAINSGENSLMHQAEPVPMQAPANLAVFAHLRDRLKNKKVVIVGRYPHLDDVLQGIDYTVLERTPQQGDLPDPAAEYILPEADWVFLTATSLINKTFARLAELSQNAVAVLIGPSAPWHEGVADFGIDFIAGVRPADTKLLRRIVAEGGGTRLFDGAVHYALADIGGRNMAALKSRIGDQCAERDALKRTMDEWYARGGRKRFPDLQRLETLQTEISGLDTRYKRQWDARNA